MRYKVLRKRLKQTETKHKLVSQANFKNIRSRNDIAEYISESLEIGIGISAEKPVYKH